tara:strand:+ start:741 stop:1175 length:435 start_codon:yes stop_codon:yes gene_type:complete
MINTTSWQPDTCGCVLYYEWNDALPPASRVTTPVDQVTLADGTVKTTVKCAAHQAAATTTALHTMVRGENQGKNRALNAALQSLPRLQTTVNGRAELVEGVGINAVFDANRTLTFVVTGIDLLPAEQSVLDAAVAAQYQPAVVR